MVMTPCLMPKVSRETLATGARQLVVQEAFETIWWELGVELVFVDAQHNGRRRGLSPGRK